MRDKGSKARKEALHFLVLALLVFSLMPIGLSMSADRGESGGTTIWDTDQVITGGYTVEADEVLIIKPGVTVYFDEYSGLGVEGYLDARGTETSKIRFVNKDAGERWGGIGLNGFLSGSANATMDYVEVVNADWAITVTQGNISISNSLVKDSIWAIILYSGPGGGSEGIVTSTTIDNSTWGIIVSSLNYEYPTYGYITENTINYVTYGIIVDNNAWGYAANNDIKSCGYGIIYNEGTNGSVSNNVIHTPYPSFGIKIYSPYVVSSGNTVIESDEGCGGQPPGPTNQSPVAIAEPDIQTIYVGEEAWFSGNTSYDSDGYIISYDWNFGDETTGSGTEVSHAYDKSGNYTVTLTVTDDDGATDTDTVIVIVEEEGQPPQPAVLEISKIKISGPDEVFTHTHNEWELKITVVNTGQSCMTNVTVYDVLPAEIELLDYTLTHTITPGTLEVIKPGDNQTGDTHLTWHIGHLGVRNAYCGPYQAELTLKIATTKNSAGEQEFTSPGTYMLNEGANATGIDESTGGIISAGPTDPIIVTAIDEEIPPVAILDISKIKTLGPDEVFTHTYTEWELRITVANLGQSCTLTDVTVYDVLPAEIELLDYNLTQGTLETVKKGWGKMAATHLTWFVGHLGAQNLLCGPYQAELILKIATIKNPAGKQEFTSPGTYILNEGASATGTDGFTGDTISAGPTAPITVTAIDDEVEDDSERPKEHLLILTAGLINIATFEEGIERTVPVEVAAYYGDVHNVHIELVDDGGLEIEIIPIVQDVLEGQIARFYLGIQVPELPEDTQSAGITIQLKAVGDETSSNIEHIDLLIRSEESTWNLGITATVSTVATGATAAILAALFRRRIL